MIRRWLGACVFSVFAAGCFTLEGCYEPRITAASAPPSFAVYVTGMNSTRGADLIRTNNSELYLVAGYRVNGRQTGTAVLPAEGVIEIQTGAALNQVVELFRDINNRQYEAELNLVVVDSDCNNVDRKSIANSIIPRLKNRAIPYTDPADARVYVNWDKIYWEESPALRAFLAGNEGPDYTERAGRRLETQTGCWNPDDMVGALKILLKQEGRKLEVVPICKRAICVVEKPIEDYDGLTALFDVRFEVESDGANIFGFNDLGIFRMNFKVAIEHSS